MKLLQEELLVNMRAQARVTSAQGWKEPELCVSPHVRGHPQRGPQPGHTPETGPGGRHDTGTRGLGNVDEQLRPVRWGPQTPDPSKYILENHAGTTRVHRP